MLNLPLRPFQAAALSLLEAPQRIHLILVAPTGSGKSRIFEEALTQGSFRRALLISPLVALHRQHALRLRECGIQVRVGLEDRTSPQGFRPDRSRSLNENRARSTWILSPESLETERAEALLSEYSPDLLIIDECHCVWDWGAAFRPSFNRIPDLAGMPGLKKSLWLTATLPVEARRGLHQRLSEFGTVVEQGSFSLPQRLRLDIRKVPLEARADALLTQLRNHPEPTIVFSVTRQGTERLRNFCREMKIDAVTYHAGLSREERVNIENGIRQGKLQVVIATSAFGMGMDFPSLQRAILWQAPLSMLDLAQAAGRVARGEAGGTALSLWHPDDFRLLQWSVGKQARRARQLLEVRRFLEGSGCHRERIERAFQPPELRGIGEPTPSDCLSQRSEVHPCTRCESRIILRRQR